MMNPHCVFKALPPTRRPITEDPFTSGARAFTVACADKMKRSYLDKKPEVAAEWVKLRDEVGPQSDNATDRIAEHPLHIPFHLCCLLVLELPLIREIVIPAADRTVTLFRTCVWLDQSSVLYSGSVSKKSPARIVEETAEGEDVSAQNISVRAHIEVSAKKSRIKKV